jgi:hypothetical protein
MEAGTVRVLVNEVVILSCKSVFGLGVGVVVVDSQPSLFAMVSRCKSLKLIPFIKFFFALRLPYMTKAYNGRTRIRLAINCTAEGGTVCSRRDGKSWSTSVFFQMDTSVGVIEIRPM